MIRVSLEPWALLEPDVAVSLYPRRMPRPYLPGSYCIGMSTGGEPTAVEDHRQALSGNDLRAFVAVEGLEESVALTVEVMTVGVSSFALVMAVNLNTQSLSIPFAYP